jgi:hypothetical protein
MSTENADKSLLKSRLKSVAGQESSSSGALKQLHVNFSEPTSRVVERKSKYLTAKYGQHQMSLIKKRLQVEMWLLGELQVLYGHDDDSSDEIDLDLDQLLDIDGDAKRREMLKVIVNFPFF